MRTAADSRGRPAFRLGRSAPSLNDRKGYPTSPAPVVERAKRPCRSLSERSETKRPPHPVAPRTRPQIHGTPEHRRRHRRYGHPMGFLYILRCADGTFYVGSTRDLDRRLTQHQAGMGAAYTSRRLPVELAWSGEFARIDDAFLWEKRIQGWSHAKRQAFIDGGLDAVRGWSSRGRGRG